MHLYTFHAHTHTHKRHTRAGRVDSSIFNVEINNRK